MKKIPDEIDNPLDNILISIADSLCPFFYKTGHTPNMLTTYSLIFGLLSCYYLNKKQIVLFGLFYFISYFFDCIDGHYARKYNMTTKFGDMYDHVKDMTIVALIIYISFKNSTHNINMSKIVTLIVSFLLMATHLSCQELNCNSEFNGVDNDFLPKSKFLCPHKHNIKWTRFFGCGTFTVLFIFVIAHINRN
jgi:phosphatidylglycerophosphate synthase